MNAIQQSKDRRKCLQALRAIKSGGDPEIDHSMADQALLEFLDALGETDVTHEYRAARERSGFWYA